jgi:hypothetical protein
MKKKLIALAILTMIATDSFGARGGVGVGNSHVVAGINIKEGIKTKGQALALLKKIAKEINEGRSTRVNDFITQGDCKKEFSLFNDAEFFDLYPIEKDVVKRSSEIAMHLSIFLKGCKKISKINDDEVFDGPK